MSISSLCDKTVTVERSGLTVSATGAYEETFGIWKTVKARIQPLKADEMVKLGRQATDIGIRIYCVPCGIQEPDRIVFGTRTFEVLGVRDIDEQGRLMTVDCVELH